MISRSKILPSASSSRQIIIAWKVSGFSQRPAIIASRPASIRLAIAISPSRDNSSTVPISRKYMRTGSSVRSVGSFALLVLATDLPVVLASTSAPSSASSASSCSTTLMPMSESMDMISSICSEETSAEGKTAFNSS